MTLATYTQVADALAALAAAVTPPAGEPALAHTSSVQPDQLGATPAVVIHEPEETGIEWGPGSTLYSIQRWPVRFYRDQGPDLPGRMAALRLWRYAFITAWIGQIQLGLHASGVDWCELRSIVPVQATYGEQTYDCLDMTIEVRIRANITASA